ncbi:MAG: imidazolonepropionase [Planctomycetota bacterium]
MAERVDSLYRGASELVALTDGPPRGAVRGAELARAEPIPDASIAVRSGKVVSVGPGSELQARFHAETEVDLSGYVVVPGFVDCHTHPVFAETREEEFTLRCQGADYVEIAKQGGGILSSVRALRAAGEEDLAGQIADRLRRFLSLGTTTIEAKSGYGLSTQSELKSLRALGRAAGASPLTVSATFLGAHELAPEYREDPEAYIELLVSEMLPEARPMADSCDAFVEEHVFGLRQSAKILGAARELGYRLRVHVDEIVPLGGTEMVVGLGAASADHLVKVSDRGIHELAESATTAVLLPGTSFFLRKKDHAPARRLIDAGAILALATDYNPGSCFTQSMPMIATLARIHFGLSPAECLNAMTRNAAYSLGFDGDRGTLHPGKAADFAVLDLPSFQAFGYSFGDNPVVMTVKDGVPVALNRTDFEPELSAQISGI